MANKNTHHTYVQAKRKSIKVASKQRRQLIFTKLHSYFKLGTATRQQGGDGIIGIRRLFFSLYYAATERDEADNTGPRNTAAGTQASTGYSFNS